MTAEATLRLGAFLAIFAVMALWERGVPMRGLVASRWRRWGTNWAILLIDAAVVRLLFGAAAAGAAIDAASSGLGLFNRLDWPGWAAFAVSFLALDLAIWLQHLLTHKIPLLWRLHRVHHADRDCDVTTAIRFHPIEIALSMGLKIGLVYALGAPVAAVIAFEVVLNGAAMFNHSNVRMPAGLERALRLLIVTPDMHRVHHSVDRAEHDANYGFNLSVWDRLFGTYVAQPARGHRGMTIGLDDCQTDGPTRLGWSLSFPFRK
jgi:sterol desaturase/sphingolipid hydroxylase (fatty acid hydroxylase superfamily)